MTAVTCHDQVLCGDAGRDRAVQRHAHGSTLECADDIRRFEQAFHAANPWLA